MPQEYVQERYYKRVQERYFWLKIGLILFAFGFGLIILSVGTIFFDESFAIIRFGTVRLLMSIGVFGIIVGGFAIVIFTRVGWSKSRFVDILFNRLGIVLVIIGQVLAVVHSSLGHTFETTRYAHTITIIGVGLTLLGMLFHSPTTEMIQELRGNHKINP